MRSEIGSNKKWAGPEIGYFDPGGPPRRQSWIAKLLGRASSPEPDIVVNRRQSSPRHVGWSLVFAAGSVSAVAVLAISVDATDIGLVACGGMVLAAWGIVLAELVSRYP